MRNYRPKHVELIEIINKIIIVATSWLFILMHGLQLCSECSAWLPRGYGYDKLKKLKLKLKLKRKTTACFMSG